LYYKLNKMGIPAIRKQRGSLWLPPCLILFLLIPQFQVYPSLKVL
jgi:hypothetical protein